MDFAVQAVYVDKRVLVTVASYDGSIHMFESAVAGNLAAENDIDDTQLLLLWHLGLLLLRHLDLLLHLGMLLRLRHGRHHDSTKHKLLLLF